MCPIAASASRIILWVAETLHTGHSRLSCSDSLRHDRQKRWPHTESVVGCVLTSRQIGQRSAASAWAVVDRVAIRDLLSRPSVFPFFTSLQGCASFKHASKGLA